MVVLKCLQKLILALCVTSLEQSIDQLEHVAKQIVSVLETLFQNRAYHQWNLIFNQQILFFLQAFLSNYLW
jgi:hypothetical protein